VAPYRIESTGLPGFDPRELELVALISRTRPGGSTTRTRHAMKRLIDEPVAGTPAAAASRREQVSALRADV